MATLAEFVARRRAKMLEHLSNGVITASELFGSLIDTFSAGREAAELDADPPAVREHIRAYLASHRPDPLPRPFVFGRLDPEEATRWHIERKCKYAALLAALGLEPPMSESGGQAESGDR